MNLDFGGALNHRSPPRAGRLIAGEEDRVFWICHEGFQMVKHTAASRHAAGRDHHLRPRAGSDFLGALHVPGISGNVADLETLLVRQAVIVGMSMKQLSCIDCHRAVEIDRDPGEPTRTLELPEVIEEGLCTADSKCRYDHGAAPPEGAFNKFSQGFGCGDEIVDAAAVR